MALPILDRLLTIVVTATVTSAAWVIAGGFGLAPSLGRVPVVQDAPAGGAKPRSQATKSVVMAVPVATASASGRLIIPVTGIRSEQLVDTFTQARAGGARVHDAIDILAPAGTPVVAAEAGTVEKLFLSRDGGNTIYVRTPDRRTIHYYAHLQDYAAGLHEGQVVRQGEALGRVGWSGNANPAAPHLHFAVLATSPEKRWWDKTAAINPYPLLMQHTGQPKGIVR